MTQSLAALALLLHAAAPDPAWLSAPPLGAEPGVLLRAAAALPPPAAGDVDVLLEEATFVFDEQGRATASYRLLFRPLGREAAARWGNVAHAWSPWHQARPELAARVIAPDGAEHRLDPATLVESGLGRDGDGLLSDRRVLQGPLPALEPGAVVEEVQTVRELAPLFEAGTVRRFPVGRELPARAIRLRIEAPPGLPLAWRLRGGLTGAPEETRAGARRVLTWTWRDVPARRAEEPLTPPDAASQPHVAISTGRSWAAVASAYAAVVDRQLAGEALEAQAQALLPPGLTPQAAAQAALVHLRERVRPLAVELGEHALVPARPSETLRRRYGDCKDLSLALAGLLRASGRQAWLVLVRARGDEVADLPGLGDFDHAIVAVGGPAPIYVDPTDPAAPAGTLPAELQGRLALPATATATGLVRLPVSPAGQDAVEVDREIRLQESGWADAAEVQRLSGWPAHEQRLGVGRLDPAERAEREQALVAGHFVEAKRGQVTFENLERPGEPMVVRLEGRGSHWGLTRADDAEAVVSPGALLDWLPGPVRPRAPPPGPGARSAPGAGDEAGAREGRGAPRSSELLLPIAYRAVLRFRVVPPPGFELDGPPPAASRLGLGPLAVTSRYTLGQDGAMVAVHELALARRRLTAAEVEAIRDGAAPMLADEPRVRFVRTAARQLDAGQGREALAELRRLIALHPSESRHWAHLAQGLLRLGLGEPARTAARKAVELEPDNGWSHRVLATTLEHDALGRWLAPGCDLAGAVAAQQRAAELDREPAVRSHLAFLLEHGEGCQRFGEGAKLDEAASLFRALRKEDQDPDRDAEYVQVLLRAGRFADAGPVLRDLAEGPARRAAQLAVRAATEGVAPAVAEALRVPAAERAAVLDQAAQHLVLARRYPEAAALLEGGAPGTSQSAQLKTKASLLARVVKVEARRPDPRDPRTLVPRLLRALFEGGEAWAAVPEVAGQHAGAAEAPPLLSAGSAKAFRQALRVASGLPERVALDVALSLLEVTEEGEPGRALRLTATSPSIGAPLTFVLVKEKGGHRLVTTEPLAAGLGAEARRLADAGDLDGARAVLALARKEAGEAQEGRPAAVLAALAPEGAAGTAASLGLAGAALESFAAPERVRARLEQARAAAVDAPSRQALGWSLAAGHLRAQRWGDLAALAGALGAELPTSARAFDLEVGGLLEQGKGDEVRRLAERRSARLPGDPQARRALLSLALRAGDAAASVAGERTIVEGGHATAGDQNNLAWALLFAPKLEGEAALQAARRAVEQTREQEPAYLHTLATVHAARGELAEAVQVLRKAVERSGPDAKAESHDWLVVGLVTEGYGLLDEAAEAYRRVEPGEPGDGLSSRVLAERRLKALAARAPAARP